MEGDKHTGGCCPPGSWPALQTTYEPKGEVFQIGGVPIYHIGQGKRVVIIITDIFGAFTGRNQSIADTFANWGYNVYVPEILSEVYKDDLTREKILPYIKGLDQVKMRATFASLIAHLESEGHEKYFAIGFCWGVWKAFRLAT
jgi:dienelactone hydrolase